MSDSLLHIKDSYYFELPKSWARSNRESREEFPDHWIRLDDEYQAWEAERLIAGLEESEAFEDVPAKESLLEQYEAWGHESANFAKPFDRFLEEAKSQEWFQSQVSGEGTEGAQSAWTVIKNEADNLDEFNASQPKWSDEKLADYNHQLDGKILIPQPFGELRNNYQAESGFTISKFMIIEFVVALILVGLFSLLAVRMRANHRPKGKLWNLLEVFLVFIRDDIARPAIGKHDADKFVPLLWTMFLFILGMNLMGMIPFIGAPTGAFGVTLAMAAITFLTGLIFGTMKFGVIGYWTNQVPQMGLPLVMGIVIVPMIFAIEILGLFIKHGVLAVRLLANMVAGHLVLLALMGLAVSAGSLTIGAWMPTAVVSVFGSTVFSMLELFVALLQAYVFTFLSALFIGSAIHHH